MWFFRYNGNCCANKFDLIWFDLIWFDKAKSVPHQSFFGEVQVSEWILLYVTLHNLSRQNEGRSRDYTLLLFMTSRVLYSAQYHRQHCTPHAFEHFVAFHMHNNDDTPTGIWAWYLQVTSPSWNEWAIGAGQCRCKCKNVCKNANIKIYVYNILFIDII